MMQPTQKEGMNQRGFSFLELLMVVGIIGTVSALSYQFISQSNKDEVYGGALRDATKLTSELVNLINRDFTYKDGATSPDVAANNLSLTLTRSGLAGGTSVGRNYQVTFRTLCRSASEFARSYGSLNVAYGSSLLSAGSSCLRTANCPQDQVPYVAITTLAASDVNVPSYVNLLIPRDSSGTIPYAMGVAACFYLNSNQLKIVVEAVYPNGPSAVGIKGREISLGITGADFKLLPQ